MLNKNKVICVIAKNKNMGATSVDTIDVKAECTRQLYSTFTYKKLSEEAKRSLSEASTSNLKALRKNICKKEVALLKQQNSCYLEWMDTRFLIFTQFGES